MKAGEDIAEFASWMLAAPLTARTWSGLNMPEHAIDDFACKAMRAQTERFFPARLAVLFTKANLLLSAGLVTQDAYDGCVGKMQIQGPGEGVFVYERIGGISDAEAESDGSGMLPSGERWILKRNFSESVSLSIATHNPLQMYVFLLEADGSAEFAGQEHPAQVKLRLPLAPSDRKLETVSWPRGIYDLRELGADFRLDVPEAPAGAFRAIDGVALISRADRRRIEGSIFLRHALRLHAPVPVPQTNLPLRFTLKASRE